MSKPGYRVSEVLEEVLREVARQFELKAAGRFEHSIGDIELSPAQKLAIMTEEVCETLEAAARATLELEGLANDKHDGDLRTELIQVAACAVAWVASLDRMKDAEADEYGPCTTCGDSTRHRRPVDGRRMCTLCQRKWQVTHP